MDSTIQIIYESLNNSLQVTNYDVYHFIKSRCVVYKYVLNVSINYDIIRIKITYLFYRYTNCVFKYKAMRLFFLIDIEILC